HATGRTCDGTHSGIEVSSSQIGLLGIGDLFQLGARDGANLLSVRTCRAAFHACSLQQQYSCRSTFGLERKATVAIYSDNHWRRQTGLLALGLGVERLTELHDIHTVLTQRRTYRWTWISLTGFDLQLDVSLNLLRHVSSPEGDSA